VTDARRRSSKRSKPPAAVPADEHGTGTTVTHRPAAEAVLRERNAFLETIITSSGDGLVVFDRDLRMTVWNPAMEEMIGLTADQVLGRWPGDVLPEAMAAKLEQTLSGVMETGDSQWREFALTGSRSSMCASRRCRAGARSVWPTTPIRCRAV